MSVAALIPIDEYLNTSYEPDCDYVEGALLQRHLGKKHHSRFQTALASYFFVREKQLKIRGYTEQRVRLSSSRVRIPDFCVLLQDQPDDDVIEIPPFICVEILSPDDSASSMMERLEDYRIFGVPNVWLVDPRRERSYFANVSGLFEAHDNILRTENPEIVLPVAELFESLH
jgi:Uma2 family endonuclease